MNKKNFDCIFNVTRIFNRKILFFLKNFVIRDKMSFIIVKSIINCRLKRVVDKNIRL